jgi:hypothetical protein
LANVAELADAPDSGCAQEKPEITEAGETRPIDDTSSHDTAPVEPAKWQQSGDESSASSSLQVSSLQQRAEELEAAVANVTRLVGKTDDAETAAALVAERRAMREELDALRRAQLPRNVVHLDGKRRPPRS